MIYTLLLSIVSLSPHSNVTEYQVDIIEINHFYDYETGKRAYTQFIFLNWSEVLVMKR